jgi:exosortase A-associated hydrolase 2
LRDPVLATEPFFLNGPRGRLFGLHYFPREAPVRGSVLYLHPFAEEMHKSRRMAALQARNLAESGFGVLQIDLTGCGDSDGDFGDASWSGWRDDALAAAHWLREVHGQPPFGWGLRLGASLAVDLQSRERPFCRLVLWQPVVSGELFLNQFLRLKLASEMLASGESSGGTKALRATLEAGNSVEIAGYQLSSVFARELQQLQLAKLAPSCPVDWIEIGNEGGNINPANQRVVDTWQAAGSSVRTNLVTGEPFWTTQEITECPALLSVTREIFNRA